MRRRGAGPAPVERVPQVDADRKEAQLARYEDGSAWRAIVMLHGHRLRFCSLAFQSIWQELKLLSSNTALGTALAGW